jgi:hypothetical protein
MATFLMLKKLTNNHFMLNRYINLAGVQWTFKFLKWCCRGWKRFTIHRRASIIYAIYIINVHVHACTHTQWNVYHLWADKTVWEKEKEKKTVPLCILFSEFCEKSRLMIQNFKLFTRCNNKIKYSMDPPIQLHIEDWKWLIQWRCLVFSLAF